MADRSPTMWAHSLDQQENIAPAAPANMVAPCLFAPLRHSASPSPA
jgi:hypothetical protein